MSSLAYRIRCVVDDAERRLAQPEIYSSIEGPLPNANVFSVEIAQMLERRQLRRRKATKAVRALNPGVKFVYGPGPVPVIDGRTRADRPRKVIGFMEAARMRKAKARRAARLRASA